LANNHVRKLRVAIVAPSLRILGGQAVQADRLLRAWRGDPEVTAWLVPHNPVPPGPLRHLTKLKYLRTLATEATYLPLLVREFSRADVIHVFSASYSSFLLAPLPAVMIAKAFGRPIVFNYHSGEAPDHLSRSRAARRTLASCDRLVVPSVFLADAFERFGLEAAVVPNMVDADQFTFLDRPTLRPRILSTRNLAHPYNVACTLRAFRAIQDERQDATLTLVGSGPDEPALRRLARDLRLDNVTFAGRVAPSAMPRVYAEHDIYVQSPDIDNMPLSLLEAFASGLPAVSTDAGGVSAMLTHGIHGLLAPKGDHGSLASHVLRLLNEPARARAMARAAHATCAAYAWRAVRPEWLRIYLNALRMREQRRSRTPTPRPTNLETAKSRE
jgi:glycosyltransferase involved in cell wall biosynthesis